MPVDYLSLASKNLIPQAFRVLDFTGARGLLNLPAVDTVSDVPDFAALEDCAGTIRLRGMAGVYPEIVNMNR